MTERLFSPSWHRVAELTPKLRAHALVVRQRFRGEVWYVLRDPATDRSHRFGAVAHRVIRLMDGRRTVAAIWERAGEELGDKAPTQDELIGLLGQLHGADVLQCDVPPDAAELFDRWSKQERRQLMGRMMNPFAVRIHLLDPDRFLVHTGPWLRPLFGRLGFAIWLGVVLAAAVGVATHWEALSGNVLDQLFTPQQMIAIWLLFPVIKLLHEFGHGFATRLQGGEIHDMGVMFLVFTPVPYVDASSSWAFPSKWRRALVGAAGMGVELFIAALAFGVWVSAEASPLRAVAYNVILVAGASTLLFNANPLLRFDGYYILSDLVEIPNLRARANRYLAYLWERYIFGVRDVERPATAPGEPAWFVGYSLAAFIYRIFVVTAILLWVLEWNLALGCVLGALAIGGWVGKPLFKGVKYLIVSPKLRRTRPRALAVCGTLGAFVAVLLLAVPLPLRTRAEGVVWIPEEALVRASTEGFVTALKATPGGRVRVGDLLLETSDPDLVAELAIGTGRVEELEALYDEALADDRARARVLEEELFYERQRLARVRERTSQLEVRANADGEFVIARPADLPGRFIRQGELIGHVVGFESIRVRAVVSQGDADLVRNRTQAVAVRAAESLSEVYPATVRRIIPTASDRLPSAALGSSGGGELPVDPREGEGDRSVEFLFEVELEVAAESPLVNGGGRVYVRFDHGSEPIAWQWARRLRQIFLERLHV